MAATQSSIGAAATTVTPCQPPAAFAWAAESIELPENAFDVVYSGNLIHHIQDKDSFYQGVRRILKPGGLFVAWDPKPIRATEILSGDQSDLR